MFRFSIFVFPFLSGHALNFKPSYRTEKNLFFSSISDKSPQPATYLFVFHSDMVASVAPFSLLFVYPAVCVSMNNTGVLGDARQNAFDILRCIDIRYFDIPKLSIPNPVPNAKDPVVAIIYSQHNGSQHGVTGAYTYIQATYDRVTS